ncbi:MAG: response regulator, partial [Clostridia bacterium]|nr:response regulator [Clostridia bacterium]
MKFNILIVEDNVEISNIIKEFFINSEYNCMVAYDGFQALEYFNDNQYHLILLDIMMPGINGFEVLKVIKETSDVPVIIISARKEEIDRLKGFNLGAEDYV